MNIQRFQVDSTIDNSQRINIEQLKNIIDLNTKNKVFINKKLKPQCHYRSGNERKEKYIFWYISKVFF